jgi:hypothetical protein
LSVVKTGLRKFLSYLKCDAAIDLGKFPDFTAEFHKNTLQHRRSSNAWKKSFYFKEIKVC